MKMNDFYSFVSVDNSTGCWNWKRSTSSGGYGVLYVSGKQQHAHRFAYSNIVGSIQEGPDLDHLCRNRKCCNPAHLEPVTRRENLLRGDTITAKNAVKTHCPLGHEYNSENTILRRGSRECRKCSAIRSIEYYKKKKSDENFMANKRQISKKSYIKSKQKNQGGAI